MRNLVTFFLFFTLLLTAWLYRDTFQAYFFQDDWFTLRISQTKNWKEALLFFIPRSDVVYYRPIGMQFYFFLTRSLFGLNPFAFHTINFFTHAINIILVYLVIYQITHNKKIALLTSFFFGTSTIHYIPFVWSSTFAFPLGFLFLLLTFFIYLKWINIRKNLLIIVLLITEILALTSNEIALILPILITFHMVIFKVINKQIIVFTFILPLFYLLFRFAFLPQLADSYKIEFGTKTFKALFTYLLWLFNWPEEIRNQLENILTGNYAFISSYLHLFILLGLLLIILSIFIIRFLISLTIKDGKRPAEIKIVKFSLGLLVAGLIFPLLFPNHTYPYYLLPSSLGAYLIFSLSSYFNASFAPRITKVFLLLAICLLWITASVSSINFSSVNHWAPTRAKISKMVTDDLLSHYPKLEVTEKIYMYNDPYLKVILSGNEAFKVLYSNSTKTVYYGEEDLIWKNTSEVNPDILKMRLKLNFVK